MVLVSNYRKESFGKWVTCVLSLNKFSTQVKCFLGRNGGKDWHYIKASHRKFRIENLKFFFKYKEIFNESLISLVVRGSNVETKSFASLYVGVQMTDKIGLKDERSSVKDL